MFFLWVNIIKTKIVNKNNFKLVIPSRLGSIDLIILSLIRTTTNTVKDEKIEDKEEYLKIKDTTNHVKINSELNP